jgi:carbamoylphosphate synthase large subunit
MDKQLIKRLATQAGEYTNEVYVPPVRSKTPGKIWEGGHVDWHDIFNEKFAELVAAHEREVIERAVGVAMLGADHELFKRVLGAIRARK